MQMLGALRQYSRNRYYQAEKTRFSVDGRYAHGDGVLQLNCSRASASRI